MGLQHFILPFSLLGIGIISCTVIWIIERTLKPMGKNSSSSADANVADVDVVTAYVDNDVCKTIT